MDKPIRSTGQGSGLLKKSVLTLSLSFGLALAPLCALAADQGKPVDKAPLAQAAGSSTHGITQAAVKAGVLACTSRINQVANFLTAGAQGVGVMLLMPANNPDQQLISLSMEIPTKEASSAYASASFAPNQATGCAGMYETVVYWPQGCNEVASKHFGALNKIGVLAKTIYVRDGGVTTKIFLMPAGTGCVTIKKEVIQ
jgi:hypothetical protein